MNIRLTPLLPSQVVGKITSRTSIVEAGDISSKIRDQEQKISDLKKKIASGEGRYFDYWPSQLKRAEEKLRDMKKSKNECIESDVEEAQAKANNLAEPVDTHKGNFDKKKAKNAETAVYGEEDQEWKDAKKTAETKKLHEERWDDDYDRDADDQKYTDQADRDDEKHLQDPKKSKPFKTKDRRSEEIDPSTAKALSSNEGVNMPMFREMIRNTERALRLTEEPKPLTKGDLRSLVKEEYVKILDEQRKGAVKIEKKLHELREDLIAELFKRTSTTKEQVGRPPLVKTLQLKTVSELIEVPVNELTIYFLNNVKGSNTHHLVEYHLGHVYFYAN